MLVAFAVLSVMLVPILQVLGGGLGATQTARGHAEAALLARSKLTEITAGKLQEGESSGDFEERGYRWQAMVSADHSDVTLPDNTVVGVPLRRSEAATRPRDSTGTPGLGSSSSRSTGSSFGRSQSSFGSGSSGSTSFGQGRSGFGSSGRSGFGQPRTGFGSSSGSPSPSRSGSGFGSNPAQTPPAAGEAGGAFGEGPEFIPYRVEVTVEWGDAASGRGSMTLTTLRLVQPDAQFGAGAE